MKATASTVWKWHTQNFRDLREENYLRRALYRNEKLEHTAALWRKVRQEWEKMHRRGSYTDERDEKCGTDTRISRHCLGHLRRWIDLFNLFLTRGPGMPVLGT